MVEGREIVAAPALEEPEVLGLMEALKESVAEAQEAQALSRKKGKRPKKMAPSSRKSASPKRKRSSS